LLPRIQEIISGPPQSFLTIAIIGVIWTASSSVEGLRTILNRAYRVHLPPPYLLRRLISIIEFFIITFSITAVIMIFVVIPSFFKNSEIELLLNFFINHEIPNLGQFIIFIFLCCAVSLLYYSIPNVKQKITKTFPGAILTVILWTITQKAFLYYLNQFDQFNFIYGSLAGIMIYLMFFYLVNLIFIFGAEFNYHLHRVYQIFLKE
jgi:membrane protein